MAEVLDIYKKKKVHDYSYVTGRRIGEKVQGGEKSIDTAAQ